MPDTGWMKLRSVSQAGGDVSWVDLPNAVDTVDNAASIELDDGEYSAIMTLNNPEYGVEIPSGATGITVDYRVRAYIQTAGGKYLDEAVLIARKTSGQVGDNMGSVVEFSHTPGGGDVDFTPTGYSWEVSDFNSALGLDIQLEGVASPGDLRDGSIYLAWVRVNWEGVETEYGTIDATLPGLDASAQGKGLGTISATLPGMSASAQGKSIGTANATLPGLTAKAHYWVN